MTQATWSIPLPTTDPQSLMQIIRGRPSNGTLSMAVGGFPVAFGLMSPSQQAGNHAAIDVAERLINRFCRDGQSPWGFFRTSYHPGRAHGRNGVIPIRRGLVLRMTTQVVTRPLLILLAGAGDCPCPYDGGCQFYLARTLAKLSIEHPQYETWLASLRLSLQQRLMSSVKMATSVKFTT